METTGLIILCFAFWRRTVSRIWINAEINGVLFRHGWIDGLGYIRILPHVKDRP
jgi:hypothetical protein